MMERDGKDAAAKRMNRLEKRVWILVSKGKKKTKKWMLTKKIIRILGDHHKVFLRE